MRVGGNMCGGGGKMCGERGGRRPRIDMVGKYQRKFCLSPFVSVVLLMVSRRGFQGLCCQGLAFSACGQ